MKHLQIFESFAPIIYVYHGTSNGALRRIIKEGLVPKKTSIYFSSSEEYAQTYANRKDYTGGVLLRTEFSGIENMKIADNIQDFNDNYIEYYSDIIIPPDKLEIKYNNKWIPLNQYPMY